MGKTNLSDFVFFHDFYLCLKFCVLNPLGLWLLILFLQFKNFNSQHYCLFWEFLKGCFEPEKLIGNYILRAISIEYFPMLGTQKHTLR